MNRKIKNLATLQFGDLNVLFDYFRKNGITHWKVKCKCGNEKYVRQGNLVNGSVTSCGCWKNKFKIDLLGLRLGRYTVVEFSYYKRINNGDTLGYWKVRCDCGAEKILSRSHLLSDNPQSCGCLAREHRIEAATTHGFYLGTAIQKSFIRLYDGIFQRCYNPSNPSYLYYGGRGITVCDRWSESNGRGFLNFVEDRFEEYRIRRENEEVIKLDRIYNNIGYNPVNTRWVTHQQNCQNTRVSSNTLDPASHKLWRNKIGSQVAAIMSKRQKTSNLVKEYVGYLEEDFRQYIESQFKDGMSWDNYGRGSNKWSIDHIIPVNRFDLSIEEDRYRCYNKFNLQPMWWIDNAKLRTKISKESIPS